MGGKGDAKSLKDSNAESWQSSARTCERTGGKQDINAVAEGEGQAEL